jgi:hypothetical protein
MTACARCRAIGSAPADWHRVRSQRDEMDREESARGHDATLNKPFNSGLRGADSAAGANAQCARAFTCGSRWALPSCTRSRGATSRRRRLLSETSIHAQEMNRQSLRRNRPADVLKIALRTRTGMFGRSNYVWPRTCSESTYERVVSECEQTRVTKEEENQHAGIRNKRHLDNRSGCVGLR